MLGVFSSSGGGGGVSPEEYHRSGVYICFTILLTARPDVAAAACGERSYQVYAINTCRSTPENMRRTNHEAPNCGMLVCPN